MDLQHVLDVAKQVIPELYKEKFDHYSKYREENCIRGTVRSVLGFSIGNKACVELNPVKFTMLPKTTRELEKRLPLYEALGIKIIPISNSLGTLLEKALCLSKQLLPTRYSDLCSSWVEGLGEGNPIPEKYTDPMFIYFIEDLTGITIDLFERIEVGETIRFDEIWFRLSDEKLQELVPLYMALGIEFVCNLRV